MRLSSLRAQLPQLQQQSSKSQCWLKLILSLRYAGYDVQVTGLGCRDEGIVKRMASGYFTSRTETCTQVLNMLEEKGVVMIRGPPRSGKTSLCQLVTHMAKHSSMFQQVLHLSCAAVSNPASFAIQFQNRCGVTFEEAAQKASASNRTLIVLDDAQNTYATSASLWDWAKYILNSPTTPQPLMILTASMHGSKPLASMGYTASPFEFAPTRSVLIR